MILPSVPAVKPYPLDVSYPTSRSVSRKASFAEIVRNFTTGRLRGPSLRNDRTNESPLNPAEPELLSTQAGLDDGEGDLEFWDTLLRPDSPPLTQLDHLLHMELLGRPISFREDDYIPAIGSSPFFIQHLHPMLWIIHQLGKSRDGVVSHHAKLGRGSPIHLVDIELARQSLGFHTQTIFFTIDHFVRSEPGFMIAQADIHLYSQTAKPAARPAPPFLVTIPRALIRTSEVTKPNRHATFRQHLRRDVSGKKLIDAPLREWEINIEWKYLKEEEVRNWLMFEQAQVVKKWEDHWQGVDNKEEWSFV